LSKECFPNDVLVNEDEIDELEAFFLFEDGTTSKET
jgi:hypothetical protein